MLVARVCRKCGKDETEVRFYDPATTTGRSVGLCCQPCWVAVSVAWRRANKDRWNLSRHKRLALRHHGITSEQFDELYADPRCAGCGVAESTPRPPHDTRRRLTIDHDHKTGAVRGLLCHDCNRTIATARDDPAILRALADYLERF